MRSEADQTRNRGQGMSGGNDKEELELS